MRLTQQLEQEQRIEASIPRISIIDSAVGRLQVQMEVVMARLDAMQGNSVGDTDEYRKGYADAVQEVINHVKNFGE